MILILRGAVLGYHLPICHIERRVEENGALFGDEAHILYVNSSIQNDTALGRLMHDFHCSDASERYSPVPAGRVRGMRETPEKVENMCREMKKSERMALKKGMNWAGRQPGKRMRSACGRTICLTNWLQSIPGCLWTGGTPWPGGCLPESGNA